MSGHNAAGSACRLPLACLLSLTSASAMRSRVEQRSVAPLRRSRSFLQAEIVYLPINQSCILALLAIENRGGDMDYSVLRRLSGGSTLWLRCDAHLPKPNLPPASGRIFAIRHFP